MTTLPAATLPDAVNADPRLGVLDGLAGYHVRRVSAAFATDFARSLAHTGMRQVLFGILSIVAENPGINQGAVGRLLGIQRANMVSLINDLVDRDLLLRETAHEDRRAFALTLTDAGRAMLATCLKRIVRHEDELLADLSDAERKDLVKLLSRVRGAER